MVTTRALFSFLVPALISGAQASVDYPPLPEDLTTPYQQRLAIYGPNGEYNVQLLPISFVFGAGRLTLPFQRFRLDGIPTPRRIGAACNMVPRRILSSRKSAPPSHRPMTLPGRIRILLS